jgi:hypothetical protein
MAAAPRRERFWLVRPLRFRRPPQILLDLLERTRFQRARSVQQQAADA